MKKPLIIAIVSVVVVIVLTASIVVILNNNNASAKPPVAYYTYTIVNTYPHDTNSFTEGLFYSDGFLYESSGSGNANDISTLRRVNMTTGEVLQEYTLPPQYFGEGIAIVNNNLIQLTWQTNIGFIYNKTTFALLGNFSYPTQGWGLTYDGKDLIMSDGTDHLYFLNPTTFKQTREIQVLSGKTPIVNINSLDYINGEIYANIWLTDNIIIINPQTGQVTAWISLKGLPDENNPNPNAVLNGIAYDQQNNRLFVTGKDWPNLYQIKLVPQTSPTP